MRTAIPHFITGVVIPVLQIPEQYMERLDNLQARLLISLVGWLVVVFAPLVTFDAGGGQSAIDIIRYVAFRGIDRDTWYAVSALSMSAGALSASAVLFGLILHSIGFVFRDWTLALYGGGTILVALCLLVMAAHPVTAISILGALALPHVGWCLTLLYTSLTLRLVSWWASCYSSDANRSQAL